MMKCIKQGVFVLMNVHELTSAFYIKHCTSSFFFTMMILFNANADAAVVSCPQEIRCPHSIWQFGCHAFSSGAEGCPRVCIRPICGQPAVTPPVI